MFWLAFRCITADGHFQGFIGREGEEGVRGRGKRRR